jgi:hypothetical protein
MDFFKQLLLTEAVALAAHFLVAGCLAGLAAIQTALAANTVFGIGASAWLTFAYTMTIGCLPVAIFSAPIYAVLWWSHRATSPS